MHQYEGVDLSAFVSSYLSRKHRDDRESGCTMAALCGDAARQSTAIQATFAAGIADMLATVEREAGRAGADGPEARSSAIGAFAQMLGAVVLSRACPDDSALADEILEVCRAQMLASLAPAGGA
jgi:TetR/AcrR family transcriptional repressor of nem operon